MIRHKRSYYGRRMNSVICYYSISLSLLCFQFHLLFLPEFPIIFSTHYSYFIPMPSPILFLLYLLNFYLSVTVRSTVYQIANTYMGIPSVIKIDITTRLYIAVLIFIIN